MVGFAARPTRPRHPPRTGQPQPDRASERYGICTMTGDAADSIRGGGRHRPAYGLSELPMVWLWIGFLLFVLLLLALDLGVFHRHAHVVTVKEALAWSAVWVAVACLSGVFVYFAYELHWFGL